MLRECAPENTSQLTGDVTTDLSYIFSNTTYYCNYIRQFGVSQKDAEDILQQGAIAYTAKVKNKDIESLEGYFKTILRFRSITHVTRERKYVLEADLPKIRPDLTDGDGQTFEEKIPPTWRPRLSRTEDPAEIVEGAIMARQIGMLLLTLSPRTSAMIRDKYVGLTGQEMADKNHTSEPNVRVWLHRARKQAQQAIEQSGMYPQGVRSVTVYRRIA